jgi:hypothetical protein
MAARYNSNKYVEGVAESQTGWYINGRMYNKLVLQGEKSMFSSGVYSFVLEMSLTTKASPDLSTNDRTITIEKFTNYWMVNDVRYNKLIVSVIRDNMYSCWFLPNLNVLIQNFEMYDNLNSKTTYERGKIFYYMSVYTPPPQQRSSAKALNVNESINTLIRRLGRINASTVDGKEKFREYAKKVIGLLRKKAVHLGININNIANVNLPSAQRNRNMAQAFHNASEARRMHNSEAREKRKQQRANEIAFISEIMNNPLLTKTQKIKKFRNHYFASNKQKTHENVRRRIMKSTELYIRENQGNEELRKKVTNLFENHTTPANLEA